MSVRNTESQALSVAVANCAKEPIHIPGAIQDVGMLFVVDRRTQHILQASNNVRSFLGVTEDYVLKLQTLDKLLNVDYDRAASLCEEGVPLTCDFSHLEKTEEVKNVVAGHKFLVFVHSRRVSTVYEDKNENVNDPSDEDTVIIEVEPAEDNGDSTNFSSVENLLFCTNSFSLHLSTGESTEELGKILAREVQRVSGYDRIMVYAFDQEWNGKVIAEENAPGMPVLYLGHQFPASDIPPQARKLYHINKIRVISDVDYKRSLLVPELNPLTQKPTDLTHSVFRAVSPIHLQYLRHMGVTASFSISIMVNNRLWGLIACHHHHGPKWMSYAVRSSCWSLGHIASLHFSNLLTHSRYIEVKFAKEKLITLERNVQSVKNIDEIIPLTEIMLGLVEAEFGMIVIDGEMRAFGRVSKADLSFLEYTWKWLKENHPVEIVYTDSISRSHPELGNKTVSVAGMAIIPLAHHISTDFLAFFRSEVVRTIPWAGNPDSKPLGYNVDTKLTTLLPRASFQSWTETVRGKSLAWLPAQMDCAENIQQIMLLFADKLNAYKLHSQIKQSTEMQVQLEMEKRLVESSNKMKTRFLASVSHEIRTPLTAIMGMVDLTLSTKLLPEQRDFLQAVQRASDSLLGIITNVLDISKMEQGTMLHVNEQFELPLLLFTVMQEHKSAIERKGISFMYDTSPNIPKQAFGDPNHISQVLSNLLSNAEKFTDSGSVVCSCRVLGLDGVIATLLISVRDTGIGIPEDRIDFVFNAFEHVDNSLSRKHTGPGLGLFMSRNIARHIGGELWAESVFGRGSTFYFKFPVRVDVSTKYPVNVHSSSGSSWYTSTSSSGSDHKHRRPPPRHVDPFEVALPPRNTRRAPERTTARSRKVHFSEHTYPVYDQPQPQPQPLPQTYSTPGNFTSSTDSSSPHTRSQRGGNISNNSSGVLMPQHSRNKQTSTPPPMPDFFNSPQGGLYIQQQLQQQLQKHQQQQQQHQYKQFPSQIPNEFWSPEFNSSQINALSSDIHNLNINNNKTNIPPYAQQYSSQYQQQQFQLSQQQQQHQQHQQQQQHQQHQQPYYPYQQPQYTPQQQQQYAQQFYRGLQTDRSLSDSDGTTPDPPDTTTTEDVGGTGSYFSDASDNDDIPKVGSET